MKDCVSALEAKWVEIVQPQEISWMYNHHELFSSDFLKHMDDVIIQRSQDWKCDEACRMICALNRIKRRTTFALRALAFIASSSDDILPPKTICNCLYACLGLSFNDTSLLEKFKADLLKGIPSIENSSLVGNVLYCMGQMKWRDPEILEVCLDWLVKNSSSSRVNDLVALILTCATVNFKPANFEAFASILQDKVTAKSVGKNSIWVDFVWSLVVLEAASEEHLSSVLNSSFKKEFFETASLKSLEKLMNIDAMNDMSKGGTDRSKIAYTTYQPPAQAATKPMKKSLPEMVLKSMKTLYPAPQFINESVDTAFGTNILAEFVTDSKGVALPLSSLEGEAIACVVWEYKDYCLPHSNQHLTGANELLLRWLGGKGVKVLQIPYYEFNVKDSNLRNAKYLQNKVLQLVQKEESF